MSTIEDLIKTQLAENPVIDERLPSVSEFPTFPRIFIQGGPIGGNDIAQDMLASGEPTPMMQSATA